MDQTGFWRQMETGFLPHLEELRQRLLIICAMLAVGMVVGWFLYPYAYALISEPVLRLVHEHHGQVFTLQPAEAFFTRCKLTVAIGIVIAAPGVIWQLWAFVSPGLLPHERKAVAPLMPAISLLFLFGAWLAYYMMPNVMTFLLSYVPAGVAPNMDFQNSINFPLKVMLAFGLAFQLPVVLLGLVALHVLTSDILLRQWRVAIMVIAVLAAIITPTGDPFNWSLLMIPLSVLYFGTVLIAYSIAKKGVGR